MPSAAGALLVLNCCVPSSSVTVKLIMFICDASSDRSLLATKRCCSAAASSAASVTSVCGLCYADIRASQQYRHLGLLKIGRFLRRIIYA